MKKVFTRVGRKTFCEIVDKQTGEVFTGVAKCSEQDDFNHVVGEKIAFHRAMVKKNQTKLKYAKSLRNRLIKTLNELDHMIETSAYEEKLNRDFVNQWRY